MTETLAEKLQALTKEAALQREERISKYIGEKSFMWIDEVKTLALLVGENGDRSVKTKRHEMVNSHVRVTDSFEEKMEALEITAHKVVEYFRAEGMMSRVNIEDMHLATGRRWPGDTIGGVVRGGIECIVEVSW